MGVMRFHPETKAMFLASVHPGLTAREVADQTGFDLDVSLATETPLPAADEIRILREIVDPERVFLR
jgi:glutaconate CoA-transferase subunit B